MRSLPRFHIKADTLKKLLKIASMDVIVQDFDYPEKANIMGELAWIAGEKLPYKDLSEEERKEFQNNRVTEIVIPDGNDYFETSGIMNFYTSGLRPERIQQWLSSILETLKAKGAEITGPTKQEKSRSMRGDVIRIPIGKITKKEHDSPPELNMSGSNAVYVFREILGYDFAEDALPNINAQDLLKRVDNALRSMREPTPDDEEEPGISVGRYTEPRARQRLLIIKEIAEWAISHGYNKILVG